MATAGAAQNRVLVLQPGESVGNSVVNADTVTDDNRYALDYHITPAPKDIVAALNSPNNPERAANQTVQNFQLWHLKYATSINASRDFLDVSYYWVTPQPVPEDHDYAGDSIRRETMKKTIFSSRTLRESIYNWLIPFYRIAFSLMSVPEQEDYLTMFREARAYAATVDIDKERLVAEGSEPWMFLESRGDHRAFVYRRIANKEIPREECIEWLDRIISDFSASATRNPDEEDNYVLVEDLGNGYFAATHYKSANSYGRNYAIVRNVSNQYGLLPGVEFYSGDYRLGDLITGSIETRPTGEYGSVFYCDSAGWCFSPTMYYGNPVDYIVRGQGSDARFIMVDHYDYDYKNKQDPDLSRSVCTLVDGDSGTIILDSIYIDTYSRSNDWDVEYQYPARKEKYTIFMNARTGLYGVLDQKGFVILPARYKSIEKTDDPEVMKVNGRKKRRLSRK
jgi:hypothetical protein